MRYEGEYKLMLRHSHLLRSSLNLAYSRNWELEQTIRNLGFSEMPRGEDDFTLVQTKTAKEIGGVNTRMLLDAPQEIEKYHFGPLQISLCLLSTILAYYETVIARNLIFRCDCMDKYLKENQEFFRASEALRNSILHQRYDNYDVQKEFVHKYVANTVAKAIEGETVFQNYLKLLRDRLQRDDSDGH